uniref:Geranylgeranyl transferase type-2 subunit alpha n=1 Tax=Ornithodoros turicata TaxID=34597 RepID=A0A2R5LLR0_9ACAR
MHGRVKVKTTAEQEEEKRKEREKKLEKYRSASNRIEEKRQRGELDDELLKITGQVLMSNPDDATLWNVRREVFDRYFVERKNNLKELARMELQLTELALQKNPKSYGAWSHRTWAMETFPAMDWDKELSLCNLFLDMDERNFHCWDYRRFVCDHANVSLEKELEFTMQKIAANFSNYSAWHYRSFLLPKLFPGAVQGSVREEILLQEYNLVQNATFTDPSDQSAWFYHRWLTGRESPPLDFLLFRVSRSKHQIIINLTKPIRLDQMQLILKINGTSVPTKWEAPGRPCSSSLWCHKMNKDILIGDCDYMFQVFLQSSDVVLASATVSLCASDHEAQYSGKIPRNRLFSCELSAARTSVLQDELEACQQLHQLEPDNKWPLLTCVLLMRALDGQKHKTEIEDFLSQLCKVDSTRKNYYQDLMSKFAVERIIENLEDHSSSVAFVNCGLTSIRHTDHLVLMQQVDLSNNALTSLRPLCCLINLRNLTADDNKIEDCVGLDNLLELTTLSLRRNSISSTGGIASLATCPQLVELHLEGNLICDDVGFKSSICGVIPQLRALNGENSQ